MPTPQAGTKSPAFQVELDVQRRVIRTHFRGIVRPADMKPGVDAMEPMLVQLGRGFTMVTDLSDLDEMDIECVSEVTRMMDLCVANGIARVVRIIPEPDKDIGFGVLSVTHYRDKVPTATYATRAEAEGALEPV